MELNTLEIGDVVATLRPRTILTEELHRMLRSRVIAVLFGDLANDLLEEFEIASDDLQFMGLYMAVISSRVAKIEGADFEMLARQDTDEQILDKVRSFMASKLVNIAHEIDKAVTQMDAPFDKGFAPDYEPETDDEKKSATSSNGQSSTGSKTKSSSKKEPIAE